MKVVSFIGTDQKGCTYMMYQLLKQHICDQSSQDLSFKEYPLPSSSPHFCVGCKSCFVAGEDKCPHYGVVGKIWEDVIAADLLIFIYPMYVMRVPGQLKALLDHWGVHWMSHRPKPELFGKKALVITQGIGAPCKWALNDVANALNWMGISDIKKAGFKLMEGVVWEQLSEKRRERFSRELRRLAAYAIKPAKKGKNLKVTMTFAICRSIHRSILKKNPQEISMDTQYWIDQGWITGQ